MTAQNKNRAGMYRDSEKSVDGNSTKVQPNFWDCCESLLSAELGGLNAELRVVDWRRIQ
jgi:hypothetical protein